MRSLLKVVLPAVLSLLVVGNAQALNPDTAYMVTGNGSTTLADYDAINNEYNYAPGDLPWVYLKLQLSDLNLNAPLKLMWSWSNFTDPNNTETQFEQFILTGLTSDKEIWKAAPQPWWDNNGGPGKWTVDVAWLNAQGARGTSTATFNVTPEPISSALFLFGGLPVAAALLRKKKLAV